jgi:nicotinic acid mononucleotide adenylyltransferase
MSGRKKIYITDAVELDVAATDIRRRIREGDQTWKADVPKEVAKYIEKYQIYN